MKLWKAAAVITVTLSALVGVMLAFAPVIYTELEFAIPSWAPWLAELVPTNPLAGAPLGADVDNYWQVQTIAPDTYAIGEPRNQLDNYE